MNPAHMATHRQTDRIPPLCAARYPTPLSSFILRTVRLSLRLCSPVTELKQLRASDEGRGDIARVCPGLPDCTEPLLVLGAPCGLGGDFLGFVNKTIMNAPPIHPTYISG